MAHYHIARIVAEAIQPVDSLTRRRSNLQIGIRKLISLSLEAETEGMALLRALKELSTMEMEQVDAKLPPETLIV